MRSFKRHLLATVFNGKGTRMIVDKLLRDQRAVARPVSP